MVSSAKIRAQKKYDKTHTRTYVLKLNTNSDSDVIGKFEEVKNRQGYIKELVRSSLRNESGVLPIESIRLLILPVAKRNKIDKVCLFGSYARNEATPQSDIDILISGGNYHGLFDFMSLKEQFEASLARKVDLISEKAVNENKSKSGLIFKNNISKDMVVLYDANK